MWEWIGSAVREMLPTVSTFEPPFSINPAHYQFRNTRSDTAYVLGRRFERDQDGELKDFVAARLWFTYRRSFPPIGGTGPTSDQGWGCMLRCAQMLLGEVLRRQMLDPFYMAFDWRDKIDSPARSTYLRLLGLFADNKRAIYSIHMIAQMGVSENKAVGEWFGPNTAAQVLKKLCVMAEDASASVAVHVALDNLLVSADAKATATTRPGLDYRRPLAQRLGRRTDAGRCGSDGNEGDEPPESSNLPPTWRPLLLIIPLRLGLSSVNGCYLPAIQAFFALPQCVGILGGRPNHALYFLGMTHDKLIYLDPHTCQQAIADATDSGDEQSFEQAESPNTIEPIPSLDDERPSTSIVDEQPRSLLSLSSDTSAGSTDSKRRTKDAYDSYHCPWLLSMSFNAVDPSLALAFYCASEHDYDDLVVRLKENVLCASNPPLFEQLEKRPPGFPPFRPYAAPASEMNEREYHNIGDTRSDDEFEVLQ